MINKNLTNKSYIVRYILLKIATFEYRVGDRIPSEQILADKLNCTRLTVRSAYESIKALDIISPIKGSGYYIKKSMDAYIDTVFANLYKFFKKITIEQIPINIEEDDVQLNFLTKIGVFKGKKSLGFCYIFSNKKLETSALDLENPAFTKMFVASGYDDFFNQKTYINYHIREKFRALIGEDAKSTPFILNFLYGVNDKLKLLVITSVDKDYFEYSKVYNFLN